MNWNRFGWQAFQWSESTSIPTSTTNEAPKKTNVDVKSFHRKRIPEETVKFFHRRQTTYFSSFLGSFMPVVTSQNFTVQSADPDARREPSQLTNPTIMNSNSSVKKLIATLNTFSFLQTIIKLKYFDYGHGDHLKASDQTHEVWPINGVIQEPLARSHIMIVPSSSPDAI